MDENAQRQLAARMVEQARAAGIDLVGPGGLLTRLTKQVLETALEEELSEHLGYHKHDPAGRNRENSRNGTRTKTVLTEIGPVEIDVPRDRDGTFEPVIVKKRQRRLDGVDHIVLSLTARGLTTGEVAAHFADVYGATVSRDTISRITEKVTGELAEWRNRPLDRVYPVIFIDAIVVKVRDRQVTNKPFYVVIGVTTAGERDILGIWGRRRRGGREVLAERPDRDQEPRRGRRVHRGVRRTQGATRCHHHHLGAGGGADLRDPPIRNTFRHSARQDWDQMAKDLRPVYTAVNADQAQARMDDFADKWQTKYPAAVDLWRSAWAEFIPFLDYDVEIRKIICTTNAIESLNARYRRAVRARGHFPNDAAAMKCLYLVTRSLDPTGRGRARWVIRWKAALNAFAITFDGRINPSINEDADRHLHRESDTPGLGVEQN